MLSAGDSDTKPLPGTIRALVQARLDRLTQADRSALQAASVQLSVPVIAACAGTLWLDEAFTTRLLVAVVAILGGIALVLTDRARKRG